MKANYKFRCRISKAAGNSESKRGNRLIAQTERVNLFLRRSVLDQIINHLTPEMTDRDVGFLHARGALGRYNN